jgi:hypothetical protein
MSRKWSKQPCYQDKFSSINGVVLRALAVIYSSGPLDKSCNCSLCNHPQTAKPSRRDNCLLITAITLARIGHRTGVGRVEMWRGSGRFGLSVAAPFVWRCPSTLALTPFPHPAHRTGHADLPHPALGQDITPSYTARYTQGPVRRTRPKCL